MIRHVSLLTFVPEATPEQMDAVAAALRALPPKIPELRDYRVGPDVGVDTGNATFVVIGDFDDEDGYRAYRDHPDHVAVAREHILPILAGRTAAQYVI
jgi:endonuclease/exonuclease/phosphatase family metal-dependent hydrolase